MAPLIGSDRPPRRAITLLERVTGAIDFMITTFDMHNNMQIILPDELPPTIQGINGRIERYDYDQ